MVQTPHDLELIVVSVLDEPVVESAAVTVKVVVALDDNLVLERSPARQQRDNRHLYLWQFEPPNNLEGSAKTLLFQICKGVHCPNLAFPANNGKDLATLDKETESKHNKHGISNNSYAVNSVHPECHSKDHGDRK